MQYLTSILGYANANYRKVRGTHFCSTRFRHVTQVHSDPEVNFMSPMSSGLREHLQV